MPNDGCLLLWAAANMTSPLSGANILNNQDYLFAFRLFKTAFLHGNYVRLPTLEFILREWPCIKTQFASVSRYVLVLNKL